MGSIVLTRSSSKHDQGTRFEIHVLKEMVSLQKSPIFRYNDALSAMEFSACFEVAGDFSDWCKSTRCFCSVEISE